MITQQYDYALSLTSQFYYCGLPLRLDSYSRCQFNCLYCFANARGGDRGPRQLRAASSEKLRRTLEWVVTRPPRTVIEEFLVRRQPIHFGGMSDPFQSAEREQKITLELLKALADYSYPTVISTKGDLFVEDEYLDVLKRGRFIVQVSMSSTDDSVISQVDLGTALPSRRLEALKVLNNEGIPTACRIQPLLPTLEDHAFDVIDSCAKVGVRHVAVEHLKLPIERSWRGTRNLSDILGIDLHEYFQTKHAKRIGREWILPVETRLETVVKLRHLTHLKGMTFGAADNDLLLLSDGKCCCSGIDLFSNFESFFSFNYAEALRRPNESGAILFASLSEEWCPSGSIARYINSHSRLHSHSGTGTGIREYIRHNWNGSSNGCSPAALFGVIDSGLCDEQGFRIYTLADEILELKQQS